jgi:hypothetical protein
MRNENDIECHEGYYHPPAERYKPNDQPAIVRENLGRKCAAVSSRWPVCGTHTVLRVVDRVERLAPAWVQPIRAGSLPADALQGYSTAVKSLPFTFDRRSLAGKVPKGA